MVNGRTIAEDMAREHEQAERLRDTPPQSRAGTPILSETEREAIEQILDELTGNACAESWVPDILRNLLERTT